MKKSLKPYHRICKLCMSQANYIGQSCNTNDSCVESLSKRAKFATSGELKKIPGSNQREVKL